MISEETWEKFNSGHLGLQCGTKEIYSKLMVELGKRGYVWASGDKPTVNNMYYCRPYVYCNYYGDGRLSTGVGGFTKDILVLAADDFRDPPVLTAFPQPPQELVNILRSIANHKSIKRTYSVQLELDSLYSKRDKYLAKWTSEFEVKL